MDRITGHCDMAAGTGDNIYDDFINRIVRNLKSKGVPGSDEHLRQEALKTLLEHD